MKFKPNTSAETTRDIDCRNTGGPFIPKGSKCTVVKSKHDGRVFVDFAEFGKRYVFAPDLDDTITTSGAERFLS